MNKFIIFIVFLSIFLIGCEKYIVNEPNSSYTFTGISVTLDGNLSLSQLANCDTLNTTSGGRIVCGNDATGAGGEATNNSDVNATTLFVRRLLNVTNINASNVTANRFTGKVDCGMLDGGSDSDFCADANTGGGGFTNGTDINVTLLNVLKINGTSLDLFNKSISLADYLTTSFLSAFYNLGNFTTHYENQAYWKLINTTSRESAYFLNANWTTLYDNRADRYGNSNFTTQYDNRADRFLNANWTSLFNSYLTPLYQLVNFTSNYDARADRFGISNATALIDNATIIRTYLVNHTFANPGIFTVNKTEAQSNSTCYSFYMNNTQMLDLCAA